MKQKKFSKTNKTKTSRRKLENKEKKYKEQKPNFLQQNNFLIMNRR